MIDGNSIMFDILQRYKVNDHFFFSPDDSLSDVCNAPKDSSGVYLVYELAHGGINLVFVGASGVMKNNGSIKHHKNGLFGDIVSGANSGTAHKDAWPVKMKKKRADALDIYWYKTEVDGFYDIPTFVQAVVLQSYFELHGKLPAWNNEY